ncbi:PTS glucose transporter subunit IIA [Vagococcus sp. DIV0080]|uniref:PTS glucose transporter subunit IIA n=1 Tax=Candidatus Vagococcus giribetii TaxID=2230876 RepID=A0ABS3HVJ7_9ENTE|nr:beta-glucoside-specific PTS transporter subunit IIABC [Vagococcus sp. DIV0080]MBO0477778.1 PTS glucose transporter subunit IIA [Vagococcus sp. DIV0080]
MKYQELIEEILKGIGGKENIGDVKHCVTRLRFNLKDESKADKEFVESITGVITVVKSGGQFQVVIGNHVPEVFNELLTIANLGDLSNQDNGSEVKGVFNKFIDVISSIFTPVLGILAATGMIKGLNAMFVAFGWISMTSGTYKILQAAGDSLMYFFPIFLGYTAAKKFKLPPFIGMVIGASLVHPIVSGILVPGAEPLYTLFQGTIIESPVYVTFLGLPVIMMNYGSSVIPIIIAVYFASKVYKQVDKIIPSLVKTFLVPLFTILIVVPLTFLVIGPIATWFGNLLGAMTLGLYNLSPVIAGLVIGGLWQVMVMFGLHWGVIPIGINNMAVMGFDPILVLGMATPFATAGVVLGIMLKTKNKDVKSLAVPSFISSLFGVSEPSIYGITLPRKKPFYATLVAASVGGLIMGLSGTKGFIMGGMGIFGIPNYINPETGMDKGFYGFLIAIASAFVIGLILALTVGYSNSMDPVKEKEEDSNKSVDRNIKEKAIASPIVGKVLPLSDVKDKAFSAELLGKGVAVIPSQGLIISPEDGTVTTLFPTKHAVGLTFNDGVEMLIHVGMDTVNLNGECFESFVEQGDVVKKGDKLIAFDKDKIIELGYSIETPVVITNSAEFLDVIETSDDKVTAESTLLRIIF